MSATHTRQLGFELSDPRLRVFIVKSMALTVVISIVGTALIAALVNATIGLRPTPDEEDIGLDLSHHGEAGYHDDDSAPWRP